ncbi:MAG: hypothetical protein ABIZ81_13405 [Opitutaceae bacterium]
MFRLISASLLLLSSALLAQPVQPAQPEEESLLGRVDGNIYIAPSGAFRTSIPVLPELGGSIRDTENVVTFQDDFNKHISIAAFPQDSTQRWELSSRGTKDYLLYFFTNFVLADFKQAFEGVQIESAKYIETMMNGSLITFTLMPGGTMFPDKMVPVGDKLPVAKRGNLLFLKNGYIFVISTELAERIIEGRFYKKTAAEEDDLLRQRLNDVVGRLQFPKPATAAAPAPAVK